MISDQRNLGNAIKQNIRSLISMFAFSFFWGWLSDRMGRRPVILMTIFGNGLCCLLFGLTVNLPMALVTRFLAGLANGGGLIFTNMYM